jgi:MerR family copper efflux transcriptional regulator
MLNIDQAAAASGVSAKMIRHYEGGNCFPLPGAPSRLPPVRTLRFIGHSRGLGFSIREIAQVVSLWQDRSGPSREVKKLANEHIRELEEKAQKLMEMKAALEHLVHCCRGDDRPECPTIESLAADQPPAIVASEPRRGAPRRRHRRSSHLAGQVGAIPVPAGTTCT